MAEGLARSMAPEGTKVLSAGSMPARVSPYAIEVMQEIGIDLSSHRSKSVDEIPKEQVGTVITLCGEEVCPVFPEAVEKLHWPHPDPAATVGSQEEILEAFRSVRDQMRDSEKKAAALETCAVRETDTKNHNGTPHWRQNSDLMAFLATL